jgi:hypothetical protein
VNSGHDTRHGEYCRLIAHRYGTSVPDRNARLPEVIRINPLQMPAVNTEHSCPKAAQTPSPFREKSRSRRIPSSQCQFVVKSCRPYGLTGNSCLSQKMHFCAHAPWRSAGAAIRPVRFAPEQLALLKNSQGMVEPIGIEPMTSCLQSRRSPI